MAPDWEARVKALMRVFSEIEPSVEVGVRKRYNSLVNELDKNYAELRTHYLAAYSQFASNPCNRKANEDLAKANEQIRQNEFRLRELEFETERMVRTEEPTAPTKSPRVYTKFEERKKGKAKKKAKKRKLKVGIYYDRARAPTLEVLEKLVSEFRPSIET